MRSLLLVVGWAASVAVAFWVGRSLAPTGGGTAPPDALERPAAAEAADAGPMLAPGRGAAPAPGGAEARTEGAASQASDATADAGETLEPFTLEGVTDPDVAMARLMRHIAALLARGKAGHLELLRFLDQNVTDGEELKRVFQREENVARYIVPGVEFLLQRKAQVVDATETVFETMAEHPEKLADVNRNTLQIFTEGVAAVLPGIVDEKRLDRFRGYARTILATTEGSLPEPVERQRRRIQQALALWAPRLTAEAAVARVRSGELTGAEALEALRGLPAEQLGGLDLGALAAPVVAAGDYRSIQVLRDLPLQPRDVALLDDTLLRATADGKANEWIVGYYVGVTQRAAWPAPQALFERGLGLGGKAVDVWARALVRLNPPAEYARWVLDSYELTEPTVKLIKLRLHLE